MGHTTQKNCGQARGGDDLRLLVVMNELLTGACRWLWQAGVMVGAMLAMSVAFIAALAPLQQARAQSGPVITATIAGPIGVGTNHFVSEIVEAAQRDKARLIVIQLDTPGGLVTATRQIIKAILTSPVPVGVLVAPSGARAASAGTYIAYAAHVVGMAPGTHLGAATPIQMGLPGMPQAPKPNAPASDEKKRDSKAKPGAEQKMLNDAIAYLRSLAQLRGRSEEWADKFVREAATMTAREAKAAGVIDVVARDTRDFIDKVDGRDIEIGGQRRTLKLVGAAMTAVEQSWKVRFLSTITDPNIAFILLLIGIYGIIFEFWSPGLTGPGVVGGISLILALFALSALPLNYAGLALVVLGLALMAGEAFAPGFGILGIGGVIAFVVGAIFLFDPAGADIDLSIYWPLIAAMAATSALLFIGILGAVIRSRRSAVVSGAEQMLGMDCQVVSWNERDGRVRVRGEIWAARSDKPLAPGAVVKVRERDGLTLVVD